MNRGRLLSTSAALFVALLLQAGLAPHVSIGGAVPNFLLLVVVTIALVSGPNSGASAGFAAGLFFDLLAAGPLGPMALVLSVVGYLTGALQANLFAEGWLLPLTVFGVSALFTEFSYWVVLRLVGEGGALGPAFVSAMLPSAVYNTVLALLVFPLLARFLRREPEMTTFRRLG